MKNHVEGSKPIRHCSQVISYIKDGQLYVKCRKCRQWVRVKEWSEHEHDKKTDEPEQLKEPDTEQPTDA